MIQMYLPDDTDVPVSTVNEGSIISQKTAMKTCVDLEGLCDQSGGEQW
jgi:antitoxin component of MazEF toxin-antitoxin module